MFELISKFENPISENFKNHIHRSCLIILLLSFTLFNLNAQSQLEITLTADKSDVLTCEGLTYNIKYKCAGITMNCTNVTMTASSPEGVIFPNQVVGITSDIDHYVFSPDRRSITFFFKEPLIAGNTGIIQLSGIGECGKPEGSIGTLTGIIYSGGVPQDMDQVSTILHSTNKFCPNKGGGIGLALDNSTYYNINLGFVGNLYQYTGIGTTSVTDVTMIDNLPPNTIINSVSVSGSDGNLALTYPPGVCVIDNTPSAPKVTCTFPANTFKVQYANAPNTSIKIGVTYPDANFNAGDNVTNSVDVQYTPEGGTPIFTSNGDVLVYQNGTNYGNTTPATCIAYLDVTDVLKNPEPKLSLSKGSSNTTIKPGEQVLYEFYVTNSGNTTLTNVIMEDPIPSDFVLTQITKHTDASTMQGIYTITYWIKTNLNPVYTEIMPNPGDVYYNVPAGEIVTDFKMEVSSMVVGSSVLYAKIYGKLKDGSSASTITNCITGSASPVNTIIDLSNGCKSLSVLPLDPFSTLQINKWLTTSPNSPYQLFYGVPQSIGTTVYATHYLNNRGGGQPLQNPVFMDLLPIGLTFDNAPGDIIYGSSSCNQTPADNVEVIPNYNGTGRTLVRLSWNNPWPSGCDLWLSLKTTINSLGQAGNVGILFPWDAYDNPVGAKNVSFFTGTSPAKCYIESIYTEKNRVETEDKFDLDGDGNTFGDTLCYAASYVGITSNAQLTSVKWVKGQCDSAYTKYPEHGKTVPGGLANYKLFVTNNGNVPATEIVVEDILPFIGDAGVIDLSARLTQWRPNLVTPVSAPAGVVIYYSTSPNPCRTDFVPSGPPGCTAPNWSTILPSDPTTIQSLKFDFGSKVLKPGDQIELTWDMRAPVTAPTAGEIAWNSFAYKAIRTDNNDNFLPAEPFKVGIELKPNIPGNLGNYVWCDANNNGIQDLGENGIDGVRVELYKDNGDGINNPANDIMVSFTSSANGGLYQFSTLPPGNYYLLFFIPPGDVVSPQNATSDDLDSDGKEALFKGLRVTITPITTLDAGETDLTWDQGFQCNVKAALGNYVWFDENQNNIQDEPSANGLNGIEVVLYNSANVIIAKDTTSNDLYGRPGYYLFDQLMPGDYYVEFKLTNGKIFTPNTGTSGGSSSDELDSDPDIATSKTQITNLAAGEVDLTWDAGVIIPTGLYKLGNFVWEDVNNNGVWESGEKGFNNVVVNLYNDVNNDGVPQLTEYLSTTLTLTETGVDGIYHFDRLPEGNYIVQIPVENFSNVLSGYSSSTGNDPSPDPDDNVENDDNGSLINEFGVVSQAITLGSIAEPLESGYSNQSVDFGFYKKICPFPNCFIIKSKIINK